MKMRWIIVAILIALPLASRADEPIFVVFNHPSGWDPLTGLILSNQFAECDQFAVIYVVAVNRYAFFDLLGFTGVDQKSLRGAAEYRLRLRAVAVYRLAPRHSVLPAGSPVSLDVRCGPLSGLPA